MLAGQSVKRSKRGVEMNKLSALTLALSAAFVISSCTSSDSGTPVAAPIGDVSGGWSIYETVSSSNSECNGSEAYDIVVIQDGSSIEASGTGGGLVTGTLSGDSLSLSGNRPFEAGTITYSSIRATIPSDCSSFNAQTVWSYSETGFSCSGTGTINADRTSGGTNCYPVVSAGKITASCFLDINLP